MSLDLTNFDAIQTTLFVKVVIPGYDTLTFSDYHRDITLAGQTYQALGELVSVSESSDELRAAPKDISITISGIPDQNIPEILDNKVKGSEVEILRGIFDINTAELLSISGNPTGMFKGVVSNYEISDDLGIGDDTGTVTIVLNATSIVELLNNKIAGRRTNPSDFDSEETMARVGTLAKSNFNFGAPE